MTEHILQLRQTCALQLLKDTQIDQLVNPHNPESEATTQENGIALQWAADSLITSTCTPDDGRLGRNI
jgi:hypothetical protein